MRESCRKKTVLLGRRQTERSLSILLVRSAAESQNLCKLSIFSCNHFFDLYISFQVLSTSVSGKLAHPISYIFLLHFFFSLFLKYLLVYDAVSKFLFLFYLHVKNGVEQARNFKVG